MLRVRREVRPECFYGDTRKKFCKIKINPYLCDVEHIPKVSIGAPSFRRQLPIQTSAEKFAQVRGIRKDPQQRPR